MKYLTVNSEIDHIEIITLKRHTLFEIKKSICFYIFIVIQIHILKFWIYITNCFWVTGFYSVATQFNKLYQFIFKSRLLKTTFFKFDWVITWGQMIRSLTNCLASSLYSSPCNDISVFWYFQISNFGRTKTTKFLEKFKIFL